MNLSREPSKGRLDDRLDPLEAGGQRAGDGRGQRRLHQGVQPAASATAGDSTIAPAGRLGNLAGVGQVGRIDLAVVAADGEDDIDHLLVLAAQVGRNRPRPAGRVRKRRPSSRRSRRRLLDGALEAEGVHAQAHAVVRASRGRTGERIRSRAGRAGPGSVEGQQKLPGERIDPIAVRARFASPSARIRTGCPSAAPAATRWRAIRRSSGMASCPSTRTSVNQVRWLIPTAL